MENGIIGEVHYHRALKGKGLRHVRDVIVWLPPSYRIRKTTRYPVLYMHDGQNLMDPSTAFIGADWQVDETATQLIHQGKLQEIIVVGIYNTPDRLAEYADTKLGRRYADFVIDRLKPMIDRLYRTKPDRHNTAVMGSSMGGLISFLFAWWNPEIFYQAACMSSSFFWEEHKIIGQVRAYDAPRKRIRLYLDVGSDETPLQKGFRDMILLLKKKGYRKGVDLQYHYARGHDHNEVAWARRLWRPLTFLFHPNHS